MFGITAEKLAVVAVVAVLIIGPARLPDYSRRLAGLVARLRDLAGVARSRVREEVGEEFDEIDWRKLDPRRYDPRRIIREALVEPVILPSRPLPPARDTRAAADDPASDDDKTEE